MFSPSSPSFNGFGSSRAFGGRGSFLSRALAPLFEPANAAAILFAFILVFMKKWEPGGNIDAVWYEAIAKNVAQTGDFFHFFVSKNYADIWDHMPLTYWIVGGVMRLLGISDFIARLYPMICSFATCLMVYRIARRSRANGQGGDRDGAAFGLVALVCYALCLGAMKWNGSLMQDVPLTTCFVGAFGSLLRAKKRPIWLCATGLFFGLGVLTKGPIIFGFAGAAFLWMLWERDWRLLRSPWCYVGLAIAAGVMGSLYLPSLRFGGRPYYELFYEAKKTYGAPSSGGWERHFAYLGVLWQGAFLTIPFALVSIVRELGSARRDQDIARSFGSGDDSADLRSMLRLAALTVFCVTVPLSLFAIKFPHYMLPVYPFIALLAAATVDRLLPANWRDRLPAAMRWSAVATAFFFVSVPLKITGQRSKDVLNLVNSVKLDTRIAEKDVIFVGNYADEMSILQSFKLYGSIDIFMKDPSTLAGVDLNRAWLIIPRRILPLAPPTTSAGAPIAEKDCIVRSETLCAVTARENLVFATPSEHYPHEVY